jgi:hypothetical protein
VKLVGSRTLEIFASFVSVSGSQHVVSRPRVCEVDHGFEQVPKVEGSPLDRRQKEDISSFENNE